MRMNYLEKAYFRKPNNVDAFKKGMPVIFYVSGKNNGPQEVVGSARITYSDRMTSQEAILNLARQGVLSITEMNEMTDSTNKLHAITFDNFCLFPNRISYQSLKDMGCVSGANLVTAEFLSNEKLHTIFKKAFEGDMK